VRDAGSGIPESEMPRIFEPFFSTKTPDRGMGLGLSISRDIMEKQGGSIAARNHPDGGAEFEILVSGRGAAGDPGSLFVNEHILIVDDDPGMTEMLAEVLASPRIPHVPRRGRRGRDAGGSRAASRRHRDGRADGGRLGHRPPAYGEVSNFPRPS
jgi:hypothetical protein